MSAAARMLAEFHEHPNAQGGGTNGRDLRLALHREEHRELMVELAAAADGQADLPQIARELADVVYVAYGTAWAFGIDLDAALAEVHRAAMDKMNAGLRRADGKVLKPPGFVPPDMTEACVMPSPTAVVVDQITAKLAEVNASQASMGLPPLQQADMTWRERALDLHQKVGLVWLEAEHGERPPMDHVLSVLASGLAFAIALEREAA